MCVQMHMYVCVHVENRTSPQELLFGNKSREFCLFASSFSLKRSLLLFWDSPAELDWLGSKLQGANRPCLPRTRITFTILTSLCHKLWRLNSDPTVCIVVPKLSFQPLYH